MHRNAPAPSGRTLLVAVRAFDHARGGGATRVAYDLSAAAARAGHSVFVVAEDTMGHGEGVRQEDGMTVVRYRLPARHLGMRTTRDHIDAVRASLRAAGVPTPDVIHGHALLQHLGALEQYGGAGVRSVYTIHSPVVDEAPIVWRAQGWRGALKRALGMALIRRLERECLDGSTHLVAKSQFTVDRIRAHYGSERAGRVHIVPGYADEQRFRVRSAEEVRDARRRLDWPHDRPVLFCVRRLEVRMGIDNLLRAAAALRARDRRFFLAIAGEGAQRQMLETLRDRLGLAGVVRFHGFLPAELLPQAYAACDASVMPTAQLECFGLPAVESLFCGRPALVTPVGALPAIVSEIEPAWIAATHGVAAIAALLERFLAGELPVPSPDALAERAVARWRFARTYDGYAEVLGL